MIKLVEIKLLKVSKLSQVFIEIDQNLFYIINGLGINSLYFKEKEVAEEIGRVKLRNKMIFWNKIRQKIYSYKRSVKPYTYQFGKHTQPPEINTD